MGTRRGEVLRPGTATEGLDRRSRVVGMRSLGSHYGGTSALRPAQRASNGRGQGPVGRLLAVLTAHPGLTAAAGLAVLLSTGSILALTVAGRFAIDHLGSAHSRADLVAPLLALGLVAAMFAVSTGLRIYFVTVLGDRVAADLRRRLYDHVLGLDPAALSGREPGDVLSRLTADVGAVQNLSGNLASVALRNLLSLVGALGLLIVLRPISAALLLFIPVFLAPLLVFRRRLRRTGASVQARTAEAVGFASESLAGLATFQAFGHERRASVRFGTAVEAAAMAGRARARTHAVLAFAIILLLFLGLAALLTEGAYAAYVTHSSTTGLLVQSGVLALLAASAASALTEVWSEARKGLEALDRIGTLLDLRATVTAPPSPTSLPRPARGEIVFEDVSFGYPHAACAAALRGVTFRIAPGERVALVGPSGAGKSTVFQLLLRFYDPQSGAVRLDEVDLRQAAPVDLRARIALVSQDPVLFTGAVADNIDLGEPPVSADRIAAAARAAQVDSFLSDRPEGLAARVGEGGRTLSGGQRQRVALARAFARDAAVLLLDEATSALDAHNERLVQEALAQAGRSQTVVVIAHRLATVLDADRILVMDQGRIVESGTHAELIARGGLYARLAALQFEAAGGPSPS